MMAVGDGNLASQHIFFFEGTDSKEGMVMGAVVELTT